MRSLVPVVVLALSLGGGGCAARRALREDTTDVVAVKDAASRQVFYRAAATVMSREGYGLLHAAEPDGFGVYHEPLRPEPGGEACDDVRLDASFETRDDRATLAFLPCLVETQGALFADHGLEICIPQVEWPHAACIEKAVARLKLAWRSEAQEILARQRAARRPAPAYRRAAVEAPAFAPMPAAAGACMKDTECKGDRICDSGRCVDPQRR